MYSNVLSQGRGLLCEQCKFVAPIALVTAAVDSTLWVCMHACKVEAIEQPLSVLLKSCAPR